jgi:hypothetical protein
MQPRMLPLLLLTLMGVAALTVATVDPDASVRGQTYDSTVAPPASTPRASEDVQSAWNATCVATLDAACASQRGNASTCAECVGAHRADLHAHGCNNDYIARWCARMPLWHYENPKYAGTCQTGEEDVQIQGVAGMFCSPKCAFLTGHCPSDVPPGVTARPTCALQGMGAKYCALVCNSSGLASQCGRDASCKQVDNAGVYICTYDAMRPTTPAVV